MRECIYFLSILVRVSPSGIPLQIHPVAFLHFWTTQIYTYTHKYKERGRGLKHRSEKSLVTWRLSAYIYIWVSAWDKQWLSLGLRGFIPRSSPTHTMMTMMMLEKAKATPSDSLMRFLQQINKQGLAVDFLPRGSTCVFLFLCSGVLWICEFDLTH